MKQLLFSISFIFFAFHGFSQTIPPPYINYQAILYDVNGSNPNAPYALQSFPAFVNINDELGNLLYREEHYSSTDANGQVTIKIGDGLYLAGPITNFNQINWGSGKYYLVVEFDINGTISATAPEQLVTVPYAFYAGNAGNGVSSITSNGNQTLTITYSNGTTYTTQALTGFQGPAGPQGLNGQSAYDLWLAQGNTGTVDDFLNASAYQIWLTQGNTGTLQDFLNALVGPAGPQGPAGASGAPGAQGPQGIPGTNGTNGLNALISTTTEPAGANCTNGGTKIETGLDANGNGTLDVSEINAAQTKYVCDGYGAGNSGAISDPQTTTNSSGNYSVLSGVQVPSFLKYFGNCANGNKVCVNNELIPTNSMFCNLTIPAGVTAKVAPAVRTVIYVQDTLFLYGTIDGSGANTSTNTSNLTSNHIGATATNYTWVYNNGTSYKNGTGNPNFKLSWTANQIPSTLYTSIAFGDSIVRNSGTHQSFFSSCNGYTDGISLTSSDLITLMNFGSNISGANGQATSSGSGTCQVTALGGQGGAGLYIIAKNIVFTGLIKLNGGNGTNVTAPCQSAYQSSSAGGGAGSCIISTENVITESGSLQAIGGKSGHPSCINYGGNGAMIIVTP